MRQLCSLLWNPSHGDNNYLVTLPNLKDLYPLKPVTSKEQVSYRREERGQLRGAWHDWS